MQGTEPVTGKMPVPQVRGRLGWGTKPKGWKYCRCWVSLCSTQPTP